MDAQKYDTCGGYIAASSGAQGYLSPEPRSLLLLLDFCRWYNVYIKQIPDHVLLFSTYHLSLEGSSICMVSIVLPYPDDFNIYISAYASLCGSRSVFQLSKGFLSLDVLLAP